MGQGVGTCCSAFTADARGDASIIQAHRVSGGSSPSQASLSGKALRDFRIFLESKDKAQDSSEDFTKDGEGESTATTAATPAGSRLQQLLDLLLLQPGGDAVPVTSEAFCRTLSELRFPGDAAAVYAALVSPGSGQLSAAELRAQLSCLVTGGKKLAAQRQRSAASRVQRRGGGYDSSFDKAGSPGSKNSPGSSKAAKSGRIFDFGQDDLLGSNWKSGQFSQDATTEASSLPSPDSLSSPAAANKGGTSGYSLPSPASLPSPGAGSGGDMTPSSNKAAMHQKSWSSPKDSACKASSAADVQVQLPVRPPFLAGLWSTRFLWQRPSVAAPLAAAAVDDEEDPRIDGENFVVLRPLPYEHLPVGRTDDNEPRTFVYKGSIIQVPLLPLHEIEASPQRNASKVSSNPSDKGKHSKSKPKAS